MGITKKFTKCTAHAEREVEVGGGGAGGSNIIAGPPPQMSSSNDVREAGTERKTRTIEWERGRESGKERTLWLPLNMQHM